MACHKKPKDITPEEFPNYEKYLKPSHFCSGGFMSHDDNFMEIYHKDMDTLKQRNITIKQITDVLTGIIEKYKRKCSLVHGYNISNCNEYRPEISKYHYYQLAKIDRALLELECNGGYSNKAPLVHTTQPIIIDNKYLMTCLSYWGFQPCPFGWLNGIATREFGGGCDYWIYDMKTKKTLKFNDMLIHFIRDHHFFEGNVYHRLSPELVIDFFDMQPDVDYSSEFVTVNAWVELKEGGNISPCQVYGKGNIMDIKQIDENTVTVDCVQVDELQREILRIPEGITKQELDLLDERFANDKHEYVFCEVLVDGLPIRRRLDVKKVGTYHKKQVKYVPVMEEQMFHKKQYGENITYTGIPKLYWFDRKIVNGEMESKYITVTLFDILDKIIV